MVPRPRPHDNPSLLVIQASADDKPSLYDSRRNYHGRGPSRSHLLLSGWDQHAHENHHSDNDEEADALVVQDAIELTTTCLGYNYHDQDHSYMYNDEDPLISGNQQLLLHSSLLHHDAEASAAACSQDAAIAALMEAQWNRFGTGMRSHKTTDYTDIRADRPWTILQTMACGLAALAMATMVLSLCFYAIFAHGSGHSSNTSSYVCPSSLEDMIHDWNRTQEQCPEDISSSLLFPVPANDSQLDPSVSTQLSINQPLDVVLLGSLLDDVNGPTWWDQDGSGIHGIEIASPGEQLWTILHQFDPEPLLSLSPKVWWISLGGEQVEGSRVGHDNVNECVLLAAQARIALLVQRIITEQPLAHIIISPPPSFPDDDAKGSVATLFHERLQCIAAVVASDGSGQDHGGSMEYYNPFLVHPDDEQDDDFFMDVSSHTATTTKTIVTVEEAQQAVILKLQELLH